MNVDVTGSATTIAAIAAGVAGLGYLIRLARRWARLLDRLSGLVEHELTHNHGTSIKDDAHGTALAVQALNDKVDGLRDDLTDLRHEFSEHVATVEQ